MSNTSSNRFVPSGNYCEFNQTKWVLQTQSLKYPLFKYSVAAFHEIYEVAWTSDFSYIKTAWSIKIVFYQLSFWFVIVVKLWLFDITVCYYIIMIW